MTSMARLPQPFLRGLEADLRSLCAEARRRNPDVKEASEQVILSLKEADGYEPEIIAADLAAAVFCAACEAPDPRGGSSALNTQIKVALRAVSSLHKLLTHRALRPSRLPSVIEALERLSAHCVDDNVTLKVLQCLLSLLTVRAYSNALTEEELSRAFSQVFALRSSGVGSSGASASTALSAISSTPSTSDTGVIEQTAKAAFRQVSSDLFASAADAAVKTAVMRQAPSGEAIPLEDFPVEVRAAFSLFADLCRAAAVDDLQWLTHVRNREGITSGGLDLALAIEVLDDGLASNIALFGGQSVFSDALSTRLCPVIHKLLRTTVDKQTLKSLLGLVVTLTRNYWRCLVPDSEALLHTLAMMAHSTSREKGDLGWVRVYAMESLRCIFRHDRNEPARITDFMEMFRSERGSAESIAELVDAACYSMQFLRGGLQRVPPAAVFGGMKPFANGITNSREFQGAIALALYAGVVDAAWEAFSNEKLQVARVLMTPGTVTAATGAVELVLKQYVQDIIKSAQEHGENSCMSAVHALTRTLGRMVLLCDACSLNEERGAALDVLAAACSLSTCALHTGSNASLAVAPVIYRVLFQVATECRESLERSWLPVLRAVENLDALVHRLDVSGGQELAARAKDVENLKSCMSELTYMTSDLSWRACHDMISALVQCSRQAVLTLLKGKTSEDFANVQPDPDLQIFSMSLSETSYLRAIATIPSQAGTEPVSLWQLLTSHFTSVCADSPLYSLRALGLTSLTRLSSGTIASGKEAIISHEKVFLPFLDLLTSAHADVCVGALRSVQFILTNHGESISGGPAWNVILRILSSGGCPSTQPASPQSDCFLIEKSGRSSGAVPHRGGDLASEAFKVVQMSADDFLPQLSRFCLEAWIELLYMYCRQDDDVNVALTSIGLLWRTADFIAKDGETQSEETAWIRLLQALKDASLDERPEIRKCAIQTLTSALTAHGARFTANVWNGCIQHTLLPLLEEVMNGVSTSSEDHSSRDNGEVQLLLHHSRDTPRKQWNETRVLALAGVAKVLRVAMPRLVALHGEDGLPLFHMLTDEGNNALWTKMLSSSALAARSRDTEVAVAGVSASFEMLNAAAYVVSDSAVLCSPDASTSIPSVESGANSQLERSPILREGKSHSCSNGTKALWEAVWSALLDLVGSASLSTGKQGSSTPGPGRTREAVVDARALITLAEGACRARESLWFKFTPSSSKKLVQVMVTLSTEDYEDPTAATSSNDQFADMRLMLFKALGSISFGHDAESWHYFIGVLLESVRRVMDSRKMRVLVSEKFLAIVSSIYKRPETPSKVKEELLPTVLSELRGIVLADCDSGFSGYATSPTQAQEIPPASKCRITGSAGWMPAVDCMLTVMNGVAVDARGNNIDGVWRIFLGIVMDFLYAKASGSTYFQSPASTAGNKQLREMYDIRLCECVVKGLTLNSESLQQDTLRELMGVLSKGAEEGERSGRPKFVRFCQTNLFRLVDVPLQRSSAVSISEESSNYVANTCGRVLEKFVSDDLRAGRCPLPAKRRGEAVFLLKQLFDLYRHASVGPSKQLIAALYPNLCKCVESRDEGVRLLARSLLDEAAPSPPGAADRLRRSSKSAIG